MVSDILQNDVPPLRQFLVERELGIGWRRRGQHQRVEAGIGKKRRELAGCLAVKANAEQRRGFLFQRGEIVRLRTPDGRVEAAFPLAQGNHVPDADAVRQQAPELVDVLSNLTPATGAWLI